MRKLSVLAVTVLLLGSGGAASAEVLDGTAADDELRGTTGADTLRGKPGNDLLAGRDGDDLLLGGPGRDLLNGGPGLDDLGGGPGNDVILAGRDSLEDRTYGQAGKDEIHVNGDDQVSAGEGNDIIYAAHPGKAMFIMCGAGFDDVVFDRPPPPETVVTEDCERVQLSAD